MGSGSTGRNLPWPWIAGIVVVSGVGGGWVLYKASNEQSGHDFWSVAVPGTLTGIGTISLAVVTVVLAERQRRRDDALRAARDAELSAMHDEDAQRDARKIVVYCERASLDGTANQFGICVVNGSGDPIVDVRLQDGLDTGDRSAWKEDKEKGSYAAVVLGGNTHRFVGSWSPSNIEEIDLASTRTSCLLFPDLHTGVITWTDSRNRHWKRVGRQPAIELAETWAFGEQPSPK